MFWLKIPTHLLLLAKTSGTALSTKLQRGLEIKLEFAIIIFLNPQTSEFPGVFYS